MNTFSSMGLAPELIRAIEEIGFDSPTPIQQKAIPVILNGKNDLVVLAQTGTGKTAAFGLPILQMGDNNGTKLQTLVLCPTRELCMQITREINKYAAYISHVKITAVYGGASISNQISALRNGCQIVVGTPGRVLDLIKRKVLHLNHIRWMILDEADEMLNMGFKDDLDAILSETPKEKQTLLFSATMPSEVARIAKTYMNNPEEVSVGTRNAGAENITHEYYMVHARDRYPALKRIADMNPLVYGIVFCRTRTETKEIADKLMQDGYNADALHGDLSQAQRDYVMNRFRLKNIRLLVATDVAARGLDVQDLTHVINYNLPDDPEIYVHRSGRTGRAGKSGVSISLIHTRETSRIKELERKVKKPFERKMVPGGREICEKQLLGLVEKIESTVVDETQLHKYLPWITEKLEWLNREELIKRFISVEFNRFLEYYKNAEDLNVDQTKSRNKANAGDTDKSYARFHINLGTKHGLSASALISLVNRNCHGKRVEFGKIEILRNFSFFEVDQSRAQHLLTDMENKEFDGFGVVIEPSAPAERPDKNAGTKNRFRGEIPQGKKKHKKKGQVNY
ncbi:MAG: DEAD/DEAH box helicase [Bacteroidales bacterium]|nr:DEAD/DEAH box helicase [Bacteroidales bacterium]MBN2814740.1 DEAD/DEAH box helicase [Bacteroidales bacterium]